MIMVKAEVIKQRVVIRRQLTLTIGMVGAQVAFRFDKEWDGLTKIAVFRQGDVVRDAPNITDVATIPSECLMVPGEPLWIGVFGAKPDGTVVIPTIESETDPVMPGSDPSGDPGTDPALPVWQQALNAAANPPKISDKGTWLIFDAINGVYVDSGINAVGSGGSGGSGEPGEDGEDGATFIPVVSSEGVISWSNDRGLPNPEPVNIRGPKGDAGSQGIQGIQGEQGIQGPKGDTGPEGPRGEKGEQGIQGIPGEPGAKGDKGDTGATGEHGVPGKDGEDGKDGVSATHSWNGTVLTVTSASGTSSADLKGAKGDKGDTGSQGIPGEKGDKGDTGATGSKGADGKTPVKGVDYFTEDDKAEIVAEVAEMLDGSPEIIITTNEHGYWYNNNGVPEFYAPADGNAVCSQETNYIKATKGDTFRVTTRTSDGHPANGAWYDANKNVISIIIVKADSQIVKTVDLTAPAGTAYARFFTTTWNTIDYLAPLEVEYLGQGAENTEPASPLKGKKIVYDGDSICSSWGISTNGGSYPQIIADIVGGTFDNQGVGGGRIVTQEGSSDTFHSIVDNLVNLPTDGDLYCFEGGVNDHWHDVPLGTFSESDYTGALDKTTYCGALETIFRYATTKFVGKPTCYIIVHKCPYSAFSKYGTEHTFADFREAALGICEKYSIPVYDAWKDSGINSWNSAQLANFFIMDDDTGTGDGTHPNEAGYRRYYVPQLIDLFERIMPIGVENIESPEEPAEPTYTNVLDTVGWKDGVYLSNGNESVDVNACTSGYIPITTIPSTIYLKNVTMPDETSHGNRVGYYKADKSFYAQMSITSSYSDARPVFGEDGNLKQFYVSTNGVAYIRVNAWQIDATSVITINEPIE